MDLIKMYFIQYEILKVEVTYIYIVFIYNKVPRYTQLLLNKVFNIK